jgi:hypothetical protein
MPDTTTGQVILATAQGVARDIGSSLKAPSRPDLIASRYDGLSAGPRFLYTFEGQTSTPVDGTTALARDLSPFTLSFVSPLSTYTTARTTETGTPVASYSKASASMGAFNAPSADAATSSRGTLAYSGTANTLSTRVVANGRQLTLSSATETVPTLADGYTALDMVMQDKMLQDAPPLTLLINPSEFSVSYTAIQSYSARGRNGLIFQRWGEQQPQLTFSGSTGAFIAGASRASNGETNAVSGMQFAAKRDSAAWQNFMSLYHFYRSNGYIYDTFGGSEAHLAVGAIRIDYDQVTYEGHIDAFDYTYDEANPHRVAWNITFTCSHIIDNATPSFAVLPQTAPTQSPSQVRRAGSNSRSFDVLNGIFRGDGTGAGTVTPNFNNVFAQTPFDFTFPSEDLP